MNITPNLPAVQLEDIFSIVSEEELLAHYFHIYKIPCVINSPLRKDENPSFSLYYKKNFKIGFFDFATKQSGGIIDLISAKFNLSFLETIQKIYLDIPLFDLTNRITVSNKNKITLKEQLNLNCKVRDWKDYDIEYWKSYGIDIDWLNFGKIFPISDIIIIKNDGSKIILPADKFAYVFVEFKDGNLSLKIYQPYSKTYKWLNNHNSSVWDLWTQLPQYGDKLIITSSRKDALCLWATTGIPSTSLQAESCIPKSHVINILKERFEKIFVLYDNDLNKLKNYGQEYGNNLAKEFGLINICIPDQYGTKDSSDTYYAYGPYTLNDIITNLTCQEQFK